MKYAPKLECTFLAAYVHHELLTCCCRFFPNDLPKMLISLKVLDKPNRLFTYFMAKGTTSALSDRFFLELSQNCWVRARDSGSKFLRTADKTKSDLFTLIRGALVTSLSVVDTGSPTLRLGNMIIDISRPRFKITSDVES